MRINPREVHIKNSGYYGRIYSNTHKVNKDRDFVVALGAPTSGAATMDHDLHRSRRALMNPYFSKRSIADMEPMMHERIGRLCERLSDAAAAGTKRLGLDSAFSALTSDIIMRRFYGYDMGYLDAPGFRSVIMSAFMGTVALWHASRFFPRIVGALQHAPLWLLRLMNPAIAELQILRRDMRRRVVDSRYMMADGVKGTVDEAIVLAALADESVPQEERGVDRLIDEGLVLLFAGTETSSRALSVTFFYLLNEKRLWDRLRRELRAGLPPIPGYEYSMAQLEKVPYLVSSSIYLLSIPNLLTGAAIVGCCE